MQRPTQSLPELQPAEQRVTEVRARSTMRPIAVIGIVILTLGFVWVSSSVAVLRRDLDGVRSDLKKDVANVGSLISLVKADLDATNNVGNPMDKADDPTLIEDQVFRTDAEVAKALAGLTARSAAESYAKKISDVDSWSIRPEDEPSVQRRLAHLLPLFRAAVKSEVRALQSRALAATPSSAGVEKLDQAGRILALYPMSADTAVLKEAKQLADQQAEAIVRLEGLRRQRYNKWALSEVEAAIKYYNDNASEWNPLKDNTRLIEPLAKQLGPIDPQLLEPAVAELYGYVVAKARIGMSDADKVRFAKRLIDTADRKMLGDF